MNTQLWQNMFVLGIPVLEKILRPVIVYFFLVIGLRAAGKRELAQLNPFDLVVLLTLSNTVQNAIIGNDNSVSGGILGATTLLLVNFLVVRFLSRHQKLDQLLSGDEDVLVEGGQVRLERLQKEVITLQELEIAAHQQGFASLQEVERAVLEPGGAITFIARRPEPEVERYRDLAARLDGIAHQLSDLRADLSK